MATGKLRRKVMQDFFKERQINKTEWICCQITYTCIADIGRHVNEVHVDDLDKMEEKELDRLKQQEEQQKILNALRQRRGEKGSSDPIRTDCDCNVDEHKVILFYRYVSIDNPVQFALDHHQYCQGMRGKVRIGQEGINATLAGPNEDIDTYLNWLTHTAPFRDTPDELKVPQPLTERDSPRYRFFKPSKGCKHAFAELSIKVVDEICPLGQTSVALGHLQDPAHRQGKLSPQDFHHILSRRHEDDFLLLDTRNYYESKIGYFEGAIKPAIRKFSQFPDYINRNKEVMRGKKILTYCTGGIRCEKATAYMRQALPEDTQIFMLDGGIHNYLEWWSNHEAASKDEQQPIWQGKNYVFDARQSLAVSDTGIASQCERCHKPWDQYKKCASKNCHLLVLHCDECSPDAIAYCCSKCQEGQLTGLCLCEEQRRIEEHKLITVT